MESILQKIAQSTQMRIEQKKRSAPIEEIKKRAQNVVKTPFRFENALKNKSPAFICEVKRASPSKGIIAENFRPLQTAKEYETAGADAISVLTEPEFFLGQDEYLQTIAKTVSIPVLRKDFVIDEYMIYEAKALGADAVLLITALLNPETLKRYLELCDYLQISALTETRSEKEIHIAINAGAKIIGVNNRNLKDFTVDMSYTKKLRTIVPPDIIFVAESGIKTAKDIAAIGQVDAVLIGETLMKAQDKKRMLAKLKGDS